MNAAQIWTPEPDGFERDARENAAPAQTEADTAQIGQDFVAEVATTVEAFVRVSPDALK